MPSFRAISLFFVASLASLSLTSAAPQYTPTAPSGCDAACMAKCHLPVIFAGLHAEIAPKVDIMSAMSEGKADKIKPIVVEITSSIDKAVVQVQACVDAKVGLDVALAADVDASAVLTIGAFVQVVVSLVASIVVCIQAALKVAVKTELNLIIGICATVCVRLAVLLQLSCQLVGGLAVSLLLQLPAYIALCAQLGVGACVDFLKVAV
ncbi:hypothetical protein AAF712_006261 [Marasmius tenuissimus]|uniref:Transmembrane protein n=1 Tax=Marasmius tenuissimus TaxID=585030 RepID=A0ABR2ZZ57_9AGAR